MSDLKTTKIIDLLPPNLRNDPDIKAAAAALDGSAPELVELAKALIILPSIETQPSEIIDHLAWQFHLDFYDPSLPLDQRRALVKNSMKWHRRKGTPSVVEELLTTAFVQSKVQEWFEYGGQPYRFRVLFVPFNAHSALKGLKHQQLSHFTHEQISNEQQQSDLIAELTRAINTVKNTRSHFEGFITYGTHDALRSFTHAQLGNHLHQKLLSGEPI
ncbi:phage tail protein I [Paenibacillus naphthalenovorans]|uniref:phage tail protein I n=1 Tax=Paenibacillus naphthalenovorans TaxID=162209 RepID=UPI003D27A5FC